MTFVLLIDGNHLVQRTLHQGRLAQLGTRAGVPTGGVFGFMRQLLDTCRRFQPTRIAVAFDSGISATRSSLLPEYKKRPKSREGAIKIRSKSGVKTYSFRQVLTSQVEYLCHLLPALGIPVLRHMPEADDILGYLCDVAHRHKKQAVLVTGDKDFTQVISEYVHAYWPRATGKTFPYARLGAQKRGYSGAALHTPATVVQDLGFAPKFYPIYHSLCGDPSDNIKGVHRIGPKRATAIIKEMEHPTLECLWQTRPDLREKHAAVMERNMQLVQFERPSKDVRAAIGQAMKMPSTLRKSDAQQIVKTLELQEMRDVVKVHQIIWRCL